MLEKNAAELKELKKEGFTNLMDSLDCKQYAEMFEKTRNKVLGHGLQAKVE
jgi:hypothetical protein